MTKQNTGNMVSYVRFADSDRPDNAEFQYSGAERSDISLNLTLPSSSRAVGIFNSAEYL